VGAEAMIAGRTTLRPVRCVRAPTTGDIMSNTETITVPHLGTSTIGYKLGKAYDASLPTLVMVNSFTTSVEQYRPQFADEKLTATANLLAIEPYGHGQSRASYEQFTYWDSAIANLQVLDALGIPAAFVLGTSQGGWIAARMAILAPDIVKGIIPLGTSMDFESQRSRDLGCWDGIEFCTPAIDALAEPVGDDWVIPIELVDAVLKEGLGEDVPPDERTFWHATYQKNYTGDTGRKRVRISTINLRDRDGLHARLDSVRCPVLRMHGTEDPVYSIVNAEDEMKLFVNSPGAELRVVAGGRHFLSASDPDDVNAATAEFINRWT
jgi:pimeloyl-ACP methyl ester carboxylesterase